MIKLLTPILLLAAALTACGMPENVEEAGTPFPEFTLTDHNGATVTKADLLGRTSVIWFYPKAATPG
jgi:cytochrome oxidase Cu insertion factor (SCO1/SenC/PrrC family)